MQAMPPLLTGRKIVVLGSSRGLGLTVSAACAAAGAEVLGVDDVARFDHLAELYRTDPGDPAAMDAVAAALPDAIDGLALVPAVTDSAPAVQLAQALAAPLRLAALIAPRLAPGAAVVVRGAPPATDRPASLAAIRAGIALRAGDSAGYAERWGLTAEPTRTPRLIGWAMQAWAMAHAHAWPGVRVNALIPATPDGRLPPALVAATGTEAAHGAKLAARAALFLLSDLSQGLTGAALAADGGLSARMQTRLEGL